MSSLRTRLVLLVLLGVLPALGLMIYSGVNQRRGAALQAQAEMLTLADALAAVQDNLIQNSHQVLFTLAQLPSVQQRHRAICEKIFANLLQHSQAYTAFAVCTPEGEVFAAAPRLKKPVNLADRPYFQRLRHTREFTLGEYYIGRLTGKAILVMAHPVVDAAGQLQAVMVAGLNLDWLSRQLGRGKLPDQAHLLVVDRRGAILVHYPPTPEYIGKSLPQAPIIQAMLTKQEGVTEIAGVDGAVRLFGFTSIGQDIHVAVGIPTRVAYAPVDRNMRLNLMWFGWAAALALLAAWWGGNLLILRPVQSLLTVTRRLAAGDVTVRTGVPEGQGELHQLGRAFDDLAAALQHREAARQQAEARQAQQRTILVGMNQIFKAALMCASEAELWRTCLGVAETLTGSQGGWIGEVN